MFQPKQVPTAKTNSNKTSSQSTVTTTSQAISNTSTETDPTWLWRQKYRVFGGKHTNIVHLISSLFALGLTTKAMYSYLDDTEFCDNGTTFGPFLIMAVFIPDLIFNYMISARVLGITEETNQLSDPTAVTAARDNQSVQIVAAICALIVTATSASVALADESNHNGLDAFYLLTASLFSFYLSYGTFIFIIDELVGNLDRLLQWGKSLMPNQAPENTEPSITTTTGLSPREMTNLYAGSKALEDGLEDEVDTSSWWVKFSM